MAKRDQQRLADRVAKLKPKPIQLPSGMWRCQAMVSRKRIDVIDADPFAAHAQIMAIKAGIAEQSALDKSGGLTVSAAIDRYIESHSNVFSPSTIRAYRTAQRSRLQSIMRMRVRDVTEHDIQDAINEDAKEVGAKTIKNAVYVVTAAVKRYKTLDTAALVYPQRKRKEHAFLQECEMVLLFDAIQGHKMELPILLALWLGMRRSEILGLCWDMVDLASGTITIARTFLPTETGEFVVVDRTKTEDSTRVIQCPGYILHRLRAYAKSVLPKKIQDGERLFPYPHGYMYYQLQKLSKEIGIPFVGIHGLRHTNASAMISLGAVDKAVMALNGWSTDVTLKQVYTHLFSSDLQSAIEKRDDFFSQLMSGGNHSAKISHEITHVKNKSVANKREIDK